MIKTKLIVIFSLFFSCIFLDATIVETTILENRETGVRIGLYGSIHNGKGEEQFSEIYKNIRQNKEQLLILNEGFFDYHRLLRKPLPIFRFFMQTDYKKIIEKNWTQPARNESDIILSKIALLDYYNCFPRFVTYEDIDNRFYKRMTACIEDSIETYWEPSRRRFKFPGLRESVHKTRSKMVEDFFIEQFEKNVEHILKEEFLKKIPSNKIKNLSFEKLLLFLNQEVQRFRSLNVPTHIMLFLLDYVDDFEKKYLTLQEYCRENFTIKELQMPISQLASTIIETRSVKKVDALLRICNHYEVYGFHKVVDLEALYRIYTTSHKKIALFAGAGHTENLAIWLQELGWSIVHKTERDCKNGVPFSDFDFLK